MTVGWVAPQGVGGVPTHPFPTAAHSEISGRKIIGRKIIGRKTVRSRRQIVVNARAPRQALDAASARRRARHRMLRVVVRRIFTERSVHIMQNAETKVNLESVANR